MKRLKTDSLLTRNHILDAAEKLFHRRGLSRPTLEEIAHEAGVTRGAIYWHFRNKCEVFNAMCERVELPGETVFAGSCGESRTPLDALRAVIEEVITHTLSASHERTVFEILTYKCELVEENKSILERRLRAQREGVDCMKELLDGAVQLGKLPANIDTGFAAMMMYGFIHGALNTSMLENTVPADAVAVQAEAARIAALAMELPARCLRASVSPGAQESRPQAGNPRCDVPQNTPQNASGNSE